MTAVAVKLKSAQASTSPEKYITREASGKIVFTNYLL